MADLETTTQSDPASTRPAQSPPAATKTWAHAFFETANASPIIIH